MWPLNSPDITTVDYCVWGVMQERVYHMPIEDIADLRQKVMSTWAGFQLSAVDEAISGKRLDACVRAQATRRSL